MNTVINQQSTIVTREDLVLAGFTTEQIEALEALRANYPYVEFLDSRKQLQRLRFMKWMIGRERSPRA